MEERRSKKPLLLAIIPVVLILAGIGYWFFSREQIVSPVPDTNDINQGEKVVFISPRPTPTNEPVATPSATLAPTASNAATPKPKPTVKPTSSATATPKPTAAATSTPAATATTAPTATNTPTP